MSNNQHAHYLYKPINSIADYSKINNNQLIMEEEEEEEIAHPSSHHSLNEDRAKKFHCSRKIMGLALISGCGLIVASYFLVARFHQVETCSPSKINFWPFAKKPENKTFFSDFDLDSMDKEQLEMRLKNKVMSISLKYIVDFVLHNEKLGFTCPPHLSQNLSQNVFRDHMDCQKYYVCDEKGVTVEMCDVDYGFDNVTKTCLPGNLVQLCNDIQILSDFHCTSPGLHPFPEDCNHFVVCTREKSAYLGACNAGDYFDPKLLICLPSVQVEC